VSWPCSVTATVAPPRPNALTGVLERARTTRSRNDVVASGERR
jgi:hypothetical protein